MEDGQTRQTNVAGAEASAVNNMRLFPTPDGHHHLLTRGHGEEES